MAFQARPLNRDRFNDDMAQPGPWCSWDAADMEMRADALNAFAVCHFGKDLPDVDWVQDKLEQVAESGCLDSCWAFMQDMQLELLPPSPQTAAFNHALRAFV